MTENPRTTHHSNGRMLTNGTTSYGNYYNNQYYYLTDDNDSLVNSFALLYNWYTAMGYILNKNATNAQHINVISDICPTGWHIPSKTEWDEMLNHIKSHDDNVCGSSNSNIAKAITSTFGWDESSNNCAVENNPSSNNSSGLGLNSAAWLKREARYWTSTGENSSSINVTSVNATFYNIHNN